MRFHLLGVMVFTVVSAFAQDAAHYIKIDSENLRAAPNGKIIAKAQGGTTVTVLERQGNWVKVELTGWIWDKSLTSDPTEIQGFQVRGSHILVETEAEARNILDQIKKGASFEELAKTNSRDRLSGEKGGDLNTFGKGDLLPEFENVIFKLKIGEVSDIVKSSMGYHIMKRTG